MRELPPGYDFVAWTPDKVAQFWDFVSKVQPDAYFAKQAGPQLVGHFSGLIREASKIIDFGCGAGHFVQALGPIARSVYGFDVSEASLAQTRARMAGVASFGGAFGPASIHEHEGSFDLGFCLEVVEHLDDDVLVTALASMHRALGKGGRLVVTTPNEEDLSQSWILCPDSGRIMHRWQHVRSWSRESLSRALVQAGFRVEATYACHVGALGSAPRAVARKLAYAVLQRKPPNLFAVAMRE